MTPEAISKIETLIEEMLHLGDKKYDKSLAKGSKKIRRNRDIRAKLIKQNKQIRDRFRDYSKEAQAKKDTSGVERKTKIANHIATHLKRQFENAED